MSEPVKLAAVYVRFLSSWLRKSRLLNKIIQVLKAKNGDRELLKGENMFPFAREFGKMLVIAGGLLVILGLIFLFGNRIPFLGNLPGDIHFERENFRFYFPLGTAILISLGGTLILNLILWLLRR